jgi:hypothetical protein
LLTGRNTSDSPSSISLLGELPESLMSAEVLVLELGDEVMELVVHTVVPESVLLLVYSVEEVLVGFSLVVIPFPVLPSWLVLVFLDSLDASLSSIFLEVNNTISSGMAGPSLDFLLGAPLGSIFRGNKWKWIWVDVSADASLDTVLLSLGLVLPLVSQALVVGIDVLLGDELRISDLVLLVTASIDSLLPGIFSFEDGNALSLVVVFWGLVLQESLDTSILS